MPHAISLSLFLREDPRRRLSGFRLSVTVVASRPRIVAPSKRYIDDSRWKLKGNPLTHRAEPIQITRSGPCSDAIALFRRSRGRSEKYRVSFDGGTKVSRDRVNGIERRRSISFDCFSDFCHAYLAAARTSSRAALLKAMPDAPASIADPLSNR